MTTAITQSRQTFIILLACVMLLLSASLPADEQGPENNTLELENADSGFEGLKIRINRNKDTPPPKVNIKFKEGYKKTDLKDRPLSNYKRSILIEMPADSTEAEHVKAIQERCQRYASDQKPFYFVTIINNKTKNQERTLSCDDEQLQTAQP